MEEAKRTRRARRRDVVRDIKRLGEAVTEKEPKTYIDELSNDLKESWKRLISAHDEVVSKVKEEEEEEEEKWMDDIRKEYDEMRKVICKEKVKAEKETKGDKSIQLKKMEPPKFRGDVKFYSRFKEDFNKFVKPATHPDQLAFTLRACLLDEALRVVTPAEDDIKIMWQRLDERYGSRSKLVDAVVGDLVKYKAVKEGEEKRLVEFIDLVETSYRNLERAGLEGEMGNSRVVGEIERKLPEEVFKRWTRHMNEKSIQQEARMTGLLKFLESERTSMEYAMESLRGQPRGPHPKTVMTTDIRQTRPSCIIHENGQHLTADCRVYQNKGVNERIALLKEKGACFKCLQRGHRLMRCTEKRLCGKDGCERKHHHSIHFDAQSKPEMKEVTSNVAVNSGGCLLMAIAIEAERGKRLNTIFDGAATASMITHSAAKWIGAKGEQVRIALTKVGGEESIIDTMVYEVRLRDNEGEMVVVKAYGMPEITKELRPQRIDQLAKLLRVDRNEVERPKGRVDLLIGLDYADLLPQKVQSIGHLMLCSSPFGLCICGWHPVCEREASFSAHLTQVTAIEQFLTIESLGVSCKPECGGCKCGKCPLGAKEYTLREERELNLIEEGLSYKDGRWTAKYPWIRDPKELPDNRMVALAKLESLEKRLVKDSTKEKAYKEQIEDMITRGVARVIPEEEMVNYTGPVHYIAHHAVSKPDSESTPLRIVFNSSASYKGHMLNNYWAKGPDLNNQLIAVLLRFREGRVALVGDVKKMYHSVGITILDQHCHRFLWRNVETTKQPTTYCAAVNFGDKPAATIAICALRKTAEMSKDQFPEAVVTLKENVYMDDVLDSLESEEKALEKAKQIERVLKRGSFEIKKMDHIWA